MKLGAEHLASYEQNGFLVIEDWFPVTSLFILLAMFFSGVCNKSNE